MQGELSILTPERAVLDYRLAGIGSRATAHLLDAAIVIGGMIVVSLVVQFTIGLADSAIGMGLVLFLSFILPILYFVLFEALGNGQTLGKRALGIRVRMADGTPIGLEAAILRNLLRPADLIPPPYLIGLASIFLSARAQRLGDLAAGTVVVSERQDAPKYAVAPHGAGTHPLEAYVGSLRGLTMDEYAAFRRLADRYYELPPESQALLIGKVYRPVAQRLGVPGPPPGETEIRMAEAIVMAYGRRKGLL